MLVALTKPFTKTHLLPALDPKYRYKGRNTAAPVPTRNYSRSLRFGLSSDYNFGVSAAFGLEA